MSHKGTSYTIDNYAKAPSKLSCGRQATEGRKPTMIKLAGFWLPGPDNPGKYARTYGNEFLQHVLHVSARKAAYDNQIPQFKRY